MCHRALELYSRKLEHTGESWTEVENKIRKQYIDESVDEAITDYGNSVLYSSSRNEYLVERMKRMLERTIWALTEQLAQGDFAAFCI